MLSYLIINVLISFNWEKLLSWFFPFWRIIRLFFLSIKQLVEPEKIIRAFSLKYLTEKCFIQLNWHRSDVWWKRTRNNGCKLGRMNECTHSTIEVETRVFFSATPYPLRSFLSHFFFTSFLQPSGEEQSSGLWILGPTRRGLSLHKRKLLNCVIKKVS